MIHIICGSTGAGKSTLAKALAKKHQAVVFSIDEWMENLYGSERNETTTLEWMLERIDRCERQIWAMSLQLISQNRTVILDLGLSKKKHREKFYHLANSVGVKLTLYYLDIAADVRWQRVQHRNKHKTATYSFEVTKDMFDFMETWFEAPSAAEYSSFEHIKI